MSIRDTIVSLIGASDGSEVFIRIRETAKERRKLLSSAFSLLSELEQIDPKVAQSIKVECIYRDGSWWLHFMKDTLDVQDTIWSKIDGVLKPFLKGEEHEED